MQITRQADYAIRAMLYLAREGKGKRVATSDVADAQRIPPSFLAKIVSQLSIAGLLHTSRGMRGGISLARDPSQITLLDVVEAIDGPIRLNECVTNEGVCTFEAECPIKPVWCDAQVELVNRLKSVNLAMLAEGQPSQVAAASA
jgi:Rrf2 family protein